MSGCAWMGCFMFSGVTTHAGVSACVTSLSRHLFSSRVWSETSFAHPFLSRCFFSSGPLPARPLAPCHTRPSVASLWAGPCGYLSLGQVFSYGCRWWLPRQLAWGLGPLACRWSLAFAGRRGALAGPMVDCWGFPPLYWPIHPVSCHCRPLHRRRFLVAVCCFPDGSPWEGTAKSCGSFWARLPGELAPANHISFACALQEYRFLHRWSHLGVPFPLVWGSSQSAVFRSLYWPSRFMSSAACEVILCVSVAG
jgi:hypothetical protein